MKTAWSILLLISLLITNSYAGQKQPHIVVLGIGKSDIVIPQVRGLYDGLEEAGYVEGKNLTIQHLRAEHADQLRDQLTDFVRQKIDVIVATSANETAIAKQVTSKIPIIFVPAIDPVRMGFVKSRARPDANLTGLSFTRDLQDNGKQLAVFKQIVPAMRRVTLFYDGRPTTRTSSAVLASVKRIAQSLKIQLTEFPAGSAAEAAQILQRISKRITDGVFLICSATFRGMTPLADRAADIAVPLFGCTATQVAEEGALMSYTPDVYYIGYRGAWYVDRILKGARPEQLPVEAPSRFELVVNLKASRRIGLTIPPEALILADKVFQ
jgi:putative tryptophan/tyrosine transport system substrate-binding protein